ncbi:MAG: hypothetical protein WC708_09795, partial [Lentisphaeria bacterium]
SVFRSRRIHIGMDETHDLGRGRFYDRHGDERHFNVFNRHLGRVVSICKTKGLSPIIWSDMYFSMGSKTMNYYDTAGVIPGDVVKSIPREASLVYWDYYHADKAFYLDWIERHRQLGKEPLMGSGVWTWGRLWHDRGLTESNAAPCVQACREAGVKELFFTMWGDDGAYCDFDSALAGLAYVAELGFSGAAGKRTLPARFKAVFGASYQDAMLPSGIYDVSNSVEPHSDKLPPDLIFWDDPLLLQCIGENWRKNRHSLDGIASHFASVERSLAGKDRLTEAGDLRLGRLIASVLAIKASLLPKLLDAYSRQDRQAMDKLRRNGLKLLQSKSRACLARFRAMWLRHNKPFGLEFIQGRYAALIERNAELGRTIEAFISGRAESIPEFDANLKGLTEFVNLSGKLRPSLPIPFPYD